MKKKLLFILITGWYTGTFYGQNIKVDAEIRSRAELRNGFREPLADTLNAALVNNLRTKLNVFYESGPVKAKISALDTRTYGETAVGNTGQGLGILEAWGEYNFTPEFSFSLGRRGLEYDDKRLFSYNNWSNTPGAHDILLLKYSVNGFNIHAGSAFNNAGDSIQFLAPYLVSYKTLNFIWLSKVLGKLSASAIWVNDGFDYGTTGDVHHSYRNTVGANFWLTDKKSPFNFNLAGYYQFGRNKSGQSLSAYLLSVKLQQRFSEKWEAQLGSDLFSGSGSHIGTGKDHTFNKLYGTNHAFNGSIEYWSTLPAQGLLDIYGGITGNLFPKFDVNLTYHYFATAKKIAGHEGKNLGSEIDLTANYIINKQFAVQAGWSSYFTTKTTNVLKKKNGIDTRFPQWAYVQLTFTPVFFTKN